MNKDQVISTLIERVEFLSNELVQVKKENAEIKEAFTEVKLENADLKVRITELEARLNSNSSNSSKPPSSDGYKKQPAFAKKKKGKQGGQQGHKGKTLQQVEHPDKTIKHKPGPCDCGHVFNDDELNVSETRQVFDLPTPQLEVVAHQLLKGQCPNCGKWHKGSAPEGVNAPVQYGNGVKALSVLLNVDYRIPFKKIQGLFSDLFGYAINEATVYSASQQCYEKLEETEEVIKSKVAGSDVVHADETGLRVAGKLHWLHTATSKLYTYLFVHKKRGAKALNSEQSILDRIRGWLVHDCWRSYFGFLKMKHAICGAHILRELKGLIENGQSKWARVFHTLLMNVYEMPFEERVRRRQQIESRYTSNCYLTSW